MPAIAKVKEVPKLETIPQPPEGSVFSIEAPEKVALPHPYCITPKHIAWAAKHWGGMLTGEAIADAEKNGAACGICKRSGRTILSITEHETLVTLVVRTPTKLKKNLSEIPGLHEYLMANKAAMEALGIESFAFKGPGQ